MGHFQIMGHSNYETLNMGHSNYGTHLIQI